MESLGVSPDTLLDIFKTEKTKIQGLEASFGQERLSRASAVSANVLPASATLTVFTRILVSSGKGSRFWV